MSATKVEDEPKQHPAVDLAVSVSIRALFSAVTIASAAQMAGYDAVEALSTSAKILSPAINGFGIAAFALLGMALCLKDCKQASPEQFKRGTVVGSLNVLLRKIAGDLGPVVISAFATIFLGLVAAVSYADATHTLGPRDIAIVAISSVVIMVFILMFGFLTVMVRRDDPPLAKLKPFSALMTSGWRVLALYAVAITAACLYVSWI